ncbi:hypothetical protein L1049_015389 [Liquidambar formosana]|uniref:Ceramidase n=1 Tax=Liquidambar formosana TaxID=63359 RepID=A0AAP0S3L3_LIQFO
MMKKPICDNALKVESDCERPPFLSDPLCCDCEEMEKRTVYAWGLAILCFVVLMIVTPVIPQSEEYHDFADKREFFGIPNTLNVVSNFPFLVIGLIGLILCYHGNYFRLSLQGEVWGWTCFFIGVAAVAVGSSYYHLKPNDDRLVWDRLPMTIAFTSIIAIFIIERIDEQKGTVSIIPLLLAGIISILYWRQAYYLFFDDLRPYALVQFLPCIAIPVMAILLPPMYTHSTYWLWAAGFYLLAKVEEAMDKVIYEWTHHIVSGHTLKHLCAAMVPVFLTLMLAKRSVETDSGSYNDVGQCHQEDKDASRSDSDPFGLQHILDRLDNEYSGKVKVLKSNSNKQSLDWDKFFEGMREDDDLHFEIAKEKHCRKRNRKIADNKKRLLKDSSEDFFLLGVWVSSLLVVEWSQLGVVLLAGLLFWLLGGAVLGVAVHWLCSCRFLEFLWVLLLVWVFSTGIFS